MSGHTRPYSLVLAYLAAVLASAPVGAQDSVEKKADPAARPKADVTADAQLDALVAQLTHDDWKRRERAQEELAKFGPRAAARLKELLDTTTDPELRARADGALRQIAENDATGPTFVTLHLRDAAPAVAFDDLLRQAGAKLEAQPPTLLQREDLPRVTIDADRQPFWTVMRQLCGACKVRPERSGAGRLLLVADDGSWARRPFAASGPFLVTANELYVTRGVQFGADAPAKPPGAEPRPADAAAPAELVERLRARRAAGGPDEGAKDYAQLLLSALFEPKLHPTSWSVDGVVEAADDAGRSLVPPRGAGPQRRSVYGGPRGGEWEGTVWLGVPPKDRPAARLARLHVLTRFTLRRGIETLEVEDVLSARNVSRVVGPSRVVVRGVRRMPNEQYEVEIATFPAGDPRAWRAVDALQTGRGPRLLDGDGRDLIRAGGSTSTSAAEQTSLLRFTADRGPAGAGGNRRTPAKLVWELPTGVQQVEVPVELADLPMP